MKKIALVDIDDTLADTQTAILDYINSKSTNRYEYSELTREFREGKVGEYEKLVGEFLNNEELVYGVKPYSYAKESVAILKDNGYKVFVCSSRKENLHEITTKWLKQHGLTDYIDDYYGRHSSFRGHEFKVVTAKEVGASVAFDDTANVAESLSSSGVFTYLIDKPWNHDINSLPNMKRVQNLNEAVKYHTSIT